MSEVRNYLCMGEEKMALVQSDGTTAEPGDDTSLCCVYVPYYFHEILVAACLPCYCAFSMQIVEYKITC